MENQFNQEVVHLYASFDQQRFLFHLASSILRNRKLLVDHDYWQLPHKVRGLLFGHHGVNHNLIKGLHSLNVQIKFNARFEDSPQCVGVLAGSQVLRTVLSFTNHKKIVAGPNFYPDEPSLLQPRVKKYLVPSQWVLNTIQNPMLAQKTNVWPVGIDSDYWNPNEFERGKTSSFRTGLIYMKSKSSNSKLLKNSINRIPGVDWRLVTYGTYRPSDLRRLLAEVDFCIYIGDSESQGIAQFACWSMNVPTFVFSSNECIKIKMNTETINLNASQYSPAPYLSTSTGSQWTELVDLIDLINLDLEQSFSPRMWVIENASPIASAKEYIRILRQ